VRRSAFTVIELLVVVTIIAILMSMVVSIIGVFITQARDAATKSTLNKVQGLANQRAQALSRLTMRKGFVTTTDPLQKILTVKNREAQFFPQNIPDLVRGYLPNDPQNPNYSICSTYNSQFSLNLNFAAYSIANDPNHTLRSSEILYNTLTQSSALGNSPISTDAFTVAEVTDTPEILDPVSNKLVGNGLPEFIDAWGNPLRFYRWPTRLFRSGGVNSGTGVLASITTPANAALGITGTSANADNSYDTNNAKLLFASLPVFSGNLAADLNRDPDDPLRICAGNAIFTGQVFEQNFHTPCTYHTLLIISAGPDGQMGLFEPDDFANFGYLAAPIPNQQDYLTDNIMYLNVRAGGK
jgi:prepilin-type N-terminal cleavage/methylation domain-containing protein